MSDDPLWIKDDDTGPEVNPARPDLLFTIATIVNDGAQYEEMRRSFDAAGFAGDCEYLALDNREGNSFEAYAGIRTLLARAHGRYVIVCHQDVRLLTDGRDHLLDLLGELDRLDPLWALVGNAGGTGHGLALRISDPHGENQKVGALPAKVRSLDENFIILKRSAMIAPSVDLAGFHLYGTDLCLQARMRGYRAYVIDFHLRHLGRGSMGRDYYACLEALEDKYCSLLQPVKIQTTCAAPVLTPSRWRVFLARLGRLRKKRKKLRLEREAKAAAKSD